MQFKHSQPVFHSQPVTLFVCLFFPSHLMSLTMIYNHSGAHLYTHSITRIADVDKSVAQAAVLLPLMGTPEEVLASAIKVRGGEGREGSGWWVHSSRQRHQGEVSEVKWLVDAQPVLGVAELLGCVGSPVKIVYQQPPAPDYRCNNSGRWHRLVHQ